MHEHPFARANMGLGDHRVVRGQEGLGDSAHRDEVEQRGHDCTVDGGDGDVVGLCAAARDAEHAITDRERVDLGSDRSDDTGELHTRDVCRHAGRRGIEAGALHQIGPVQPGAVDAHHRTVGGRFRDGSVGQLQTAVHDRDRTHEPAT